MSKHYRVGEQYLGAFVDGLPEHVDAIECPAPVSASSRWVSGDWVEQQTVPTIVSRAQGIMALHNMGMLTTVEAAVDVSDITVQLAWQSVTEFHRDSPMINALAVELGLDLDALFSAAATIKL